VNQCAFVYLIVGSTLIYHYSVCEVDLSLGNWRELHHHAACSLINIHTTTLLPSSFYGERCYWTRLYELARLQLVANYLSVQSSD